MSTWTPYLGDTYLNWSEIEDWCRDAARSHPDWVTLETVGQSRMGRPLILFKIGVQDADLDRRPGFWLDGGTHAAEWTGVMSALYTVSKWLQALADGDPKEVEFFSGHTAYIMPCISSYSTEHRFYGLPFGRLPMRPRASVLTPMTSPVTASSDGCDGRTRPGPM